MSNDYNGKKRSELPDNVFGIPQERKYPMPDEKHTRSAIKLFNHVEPKYEEQLAKAIIKNMKKYNIDGSVVGPNNRLRKYLPKDMIKESMLLEGLLKSDKDIYYNKDKFDSGEINLCFITGLSGSGKSTMGRGMTSKNIEHYEMDDVICNDNFSDSNLKEYGGLIESFFKESGKSFRLLRDDDSHNNDVFKSHKNYEKEITQAFVKHALSYCKSHKNTKFICDGIWVFMFINPSQLKDCAVYIKGTSSIKSGYRALKRDIDEDKRNGMTSLDIFKREFRRIKEDVLYAKENQKELKSFRSYFEKQSTNESVSSTVSKDHKQKGHIKLSSLKKVRITEYLIDKYKKEYPVLRHVRCKDTDEYVCDGYMWFKDDNLVCYVGYCQYTDDNTKWIVSLEILPEYRGYGLSTQILDFCVKSMKCKYLSVNKNNELAKKIYDKYGFKVYHEDKTMYYMTLDTISPKNESGGYIYSFERSPIQEYDYIPESGVLSVIKPIPTKDKNKIKYIMEDLGDDFKDFVFANICFYDIEECEKTPTGFVILRKKPELHTAFVSIGVLEQHRNSGVGSKLLQKAISYFKSTKDLMWLEYWVNIDNKASIALAEKSGFVEYLSGDTAKALGYYHYHMKNNNNLYERIEKSSSRKITTVVFDLGDVLIKSNMQNKLKKNPKIPNQQIYPLLEKWFDDDLDLLSKDEYIDIISKRLSPDFSDIVPDIVDAFSDIEVLPYTIPTLKDLREKGYRIYYLSNWSRWGVEILGEKNKLEFLSLFDGGLFSYEVGVKKPDRKIYDTFIKKFKINPKEAIFVDNKKKNIEAAKKFGLQGIVFDKLDISLVYDVLEESSISEYGTTGGTIVGSNQPDSVYIVNYMQNNAFSGHKEPKFGVCRKGMKDLHIVGGKYNRFHYVSDLDKFKEEASDIHVYRYKGKPKNEFFDIIEEMKDDNDLDLYKLITGREIKDRSEIQFDGDFIEEECFFDTIDAIRACTEAGLLEASTDLHPVPILTETVQGRPYNYYRDLNGVFIQHEITGLRSKSYDTLDDIPDAETEIVKRGYLV